eukprot:5497691-Amphidinium_carterae.2
MTITSKHPPTRVFKPTTTRLRVFTIFNIRLEANIPTVNPQGWNTLAPQLKIGTVWHRSPMP